MSEGALRGIRVIDMAEGLAGSIAALLLAETGADVVKLEPPEGSALRGTAAFSIWNRSKRSVTLDSVRDERELDRLLAGADVIVHDLSFETARAKKLDKNALRRRAPHLILCHVTGCPEGHEDEALPASDTLVLAASGICDEQAAIRRDGPVYLRFPLGSWGAAWLAAIGVLTQILAAQQGQQATSLSTSLLQGALLPVMMLWRRTEHPAPALAASDNKRGRPSLAECADGVWIHLMKSPDGAPLMKAALDALGPALVKTMNERAGPQSPMFPNWGANVEILKTRPSTEWLPALWEADVAVQPAVPMGNLYFDEQAEENGYVIEVDDHVFGASRQPGHPFDVKPRPQMRGPAPRLGANSADVLEGWTPRAKKTVSRRLSRPLEGIKVVDFGNFLAGPLAPMLMADLGADVIKLESTAGDQMRWAEFAFLACQRNKRSIAAELKDPATRTIVERLVAEADVVHHNLRMPAAIRLGLDYESIRKINPRAVYCHVSSYGPRGPRKDWPGYDQLFQASSGWEYEGAGEGNRPMWHRFGMMDHQGALASLYATMIGLIERERTGEGQFVSSSLLGASLLTMSETLINADGVLTPFARLDADQLGVSPRDRLYNTADGWLALQASEAGFRTFCDMLTVGGQASPEESLARLPLSTALGYARAAGCGAAPVRLNQRDAFLTNENNRRLGLAITLPHAKHGALDQPGAFWAFDGQQLRFDRAPPLLGEHTVEILEELGFDAAQIDSMKTKGVVVAA